MSNGLEQLSTKMRRVGFANTHSAGVETLAKNVDVRCAPALASMRVPLVHSQ